MIFTIIALSFANGTSGKFSKTLSAKKVDHPQTAWNQNPNPDFLLAYLAMVTLCKSIFAEYRTFQNLATRQHHISLLHNAKLKQLNGK